MVWCVGVAIGVWLVGSKRCGGLVGAGGEGCGEQSGVGARGVVRAHVPSSTPHRITAIPSFATGMH